MLVFLFFSPIFFSHIHRGRKEEKDGWGGKVACTVEGGGVLLVPWEVMVGRRSRVQMYMFQHIRIAPHSEGFL